MCCLWWRKALHGKLLPNLCEPEIGYWVCMGKASLISLRSTSFWIQLFFTWKSINVYQCNSGYDEDKRNIKASNERFLYSLPWEFSMCNRHVLSHDSINHHAPNKENTTWLKVELTSIQISQHRYSNYDGFTAVSTWFIIKSGEVSILPFISH